MACSDCGHPSRNKHYDGCPRGSSSGGSGRTGKHLWSGWSGWTYVPGTNNETEQRSRYCQDRTCTVAPEVQTRRSKR